LAEWISLLQSSVPYAVGAAGALASAWIGFKRGKKERALERRIVWHEKAIEGLAAYEEQLERLRNYAVTSVVNQHASEHQQRRGHTAAPAEPSDLPTRFVPAEPLWTEVSKTEERARAALRLADVYVPDLRLQVECSAALTSAVNLVGTSLFIALEGSPGMPWADLSSRAIQVGILRRKLQESLSVVLEMEGLAAALLGSRYRTWLMRRRIDALRAALDKPAG
jgi:hypothetical protein